jgi:hypothetical protein
MQHLPTALVSYRVGSDPIPKPGSYRQQGAER